MIFILSLGMSAAHVFVSPHFDDAIGSCGGTIARLVSRGQPVRVVTVFGGPERLPFSFPAQVLHKEWELDLPVAHRRREDAKACELLGCEQAVLEIPDAIYRQDAAGRHLYPTFESLREPPAPADERLMGMIASALEASLVDSGTVLYFPLGIGAHVDHILTKECGRVLAARHIVVSYRDFAYDRAWDGRIDDASARRLNVALTEQELTAKRAAFSAYRSQIVDLFTCDDSMNAYFETIGRHESLFLPGQMLLEDSSRLRSLLA